WRGTDSDPPPEAVPMKFDLLYELQAPKPHDERSEYRCYQEALAQIELADRLGYDTVWEVEHHFLTEFAHSSAPEVFLAAVPQRSILPKPLQKPHPPIWMAATSPQSWEIAGRNGIGILGLTIFVSVPQLAERVRAYRAALAQAKPVGKFVNDRVGAFTIVHVA